jgi:hypothetical protein
VAQQSMRIGDIRRIIESARWSRNDLGGATRDEFRRMDVATRLQRHIDALRALQIPSRFTKDIAERDEEIGRCEATIARWRSVQVPPRDPPPAGHSATLIQFPVRTIAVAMPQWRAA